MALFDRKAFNPEVIANGLIEEFRIYTIRLMKTGTHEDYDDVFEFMDAAWESFKVRYDKEMITKLKSLLVFP